MAANTITPEVAVEDLERATEPLGSLLQVLEEVERHLGSFEHQGDIQRSMLWMLDGFTDALMVDLHELVRGTLDIRRTINGGMTEEERGIAVAFGIEFDRRFDDA